jgi:pimeloyl-ACP methyl ester carboxylesterase
METKTLILAITLWTKLLTKARIKILLRLFAFVFTPIAFISTVQAQEAVWPEQTFYRNIEVNGHNVFYREAGDINKPTILFLHGFPSSSHMYRHLIPLLSGSFHIIAPDNLGSGHSDKPNPSKHPYTFDLLTDVMESFVNNLNIKEYTIYMQDFGAPVGFRLMMRQPKKIKGLISQNGNAYLEGLTLPRQTFFKQAHEDRSFEMLKKLYNATSLQGVRDKQYLRDVKGKEEIMSPDSWIYDLHFLETEQQQMIQVQLLQDYYSNLLAYPEWQDFLRKNQTPTLLVWGKNDPAFISAGAKAYLKDVPKAELHLLDAGHFAMEEKPVEIAKHIMRFMEKNK